MCIVRVIKLRGMNHHRLRLQIPYWLSLGVCTSGQGTASWKVEDKISISQALACREAGFGLNFNVYGEAWSDVGSILYTHRALPPLTHHTHLLRMWLDCVCVLIHFSTETKASKTSFQFFFSTKHSSKWNL